MLKLEAAIAPFLLDELKDTLMEVGVHSLASWEIRSANRPLIGIAGTGEVPDSIEFLPEVRLEVVMDESHKEGVLAVLRDHICKRGSGGAEIIIYSLDKAVRMTVDSAGKPLVTEI